MIIYILRCGPGTWLLDLSNRYENSHFIGVDLKPVFPQEVINIIYKILFYFILIYQNRTFDYIN
jgi:hypothetical protein